MTMRQSLGFLWRRLRSPLLMAGVVIMVAAIPSSILAPELRLLLFSLALVLAAAADGRRAALVAGLLPAAFLTLPLLRPGPRASLTDLSVLCSFVIAALFIAFVVGGVHERLELAVKRVEGDQERLEEVIREKANFMNAAAHELRTPLTVVLGYLSMLLSGDFGPPPARWPAVLAMMRAKTGELSGLVEQMLVAARVDAGTIPTATVRFDLREAVRQAVERAEPHTTLAQATVTLQLPSRVDMVAADKDHVASILDRLIEFALGAAEGHPWIRITVTENGDAEAPVEALVEDRGRAIPAEMQTRLFDRFVRVDDPGPASRGAPLGLAVSRDLARRHGGDLVLLSSESGVGTVFALRLPRAGKDTGAAGRDN
jgi:signal transduction histidine kinase